MRPGDMTAVLTQEPTGLMGGAFNCTAVRPRADVLMSWQQQTMQNLTDMHCSCKQR